MKIGPGVSELWGIENCPLPLTRPIHGLYNSLYYRTSRERNKLITPLLCGFCKQRSTTDHLVCLESFIREDFIQRQHAVAICFDLEKAYDCTWKYGIMKDLHQAGLRGRLLLYWRFLKK